MAPPLLRRAQEVFGDVDRERGVGTGQPERRIGVELVDVGDRKSVV